MRSTLIRRLALPAVLGGTVGSPLIPRCSEGGALASAPPGIHAFRGEHPRPDPAVADTFRYDLRPGDHLIYRQRLVQEVDGRRRYGVPEAAAGPFESPHLFEFEAEWTSHLVVLGGGTEDLTLGVTRHRTLAGLLRHLPTEAEAREAGLRLLQQRAQIGGTPFGEGVRISARGELTLPPVALREWPSKVLWALRELPGLPPRSALRGVRGAWAGDRLLGLRMRIAGEEEVAGERCTRVEGEGTTSWILSRDASVPDTLRLRYWFCPGSGLVPRVEFEGAYPDGIFRRVRERLSLELIERRRGETPAAWLSDTETRAGTLAGLLVADSVGLEPDRLYGLLAGADVATVELLLALAWRRGWDPPALDLLDAALTSPAPRLRTLAVRLLERLPPAEAAPRLARTGEDEDYFVRRAAEEAAGRRARVGPGEGGPAGGTRGGDDPAAEHPQGRTSCDPDQVLSRHAARRLAPQPPGVRLRRFQTPPQRGWPWAAHVPSDYTGERPFPLLVYLAGNSGPVMEGVLIGGPAAVGSGYLVVFPEANGLWWEPHATAALDELLRDVLREFRVDPERIYLSGLSNGGTGTYYYATRWPHRFTAAVSAMGGGAFVSFLDPPFPENATHLPLLFLHGERDATIPAEATRRTVERFRGHRATLEARYFPDRGHGIALGRGDDGLTFRFLQRHEGRAWPRELRFRTRSRPPLRHYWLEVLETAEGAELEGAEVRAKLRDGRIDLETRGVRRLRLLLTPPLLPADGNVEVRVEGRRVWEGSVRPDCELLRRTLEEEGDPYLAWAAELEVPLP